MKDSNVNNGDPAKGRWEGLEATVDSGAADTVGPESTAEWVRTKETKASKAGLKYNAAEGSEIRNIENGN